MALNLFTPGEKMVDRKHDVEAEIKALLEAFQLLELGGLSPEVLKKIA